MHAIGADPEEFHRVDLYAGHEALLLDYERALTRIDSRTGLPYDVSGHFVWVGERTRQLDGAHVDFAARPQPDRGEARPDRHARRGARAGRAARPRPRARAGSPSSPAWAPARSRDVLPPIVEKVDASGSPVAVGLRPDARQHLEAASGHKTRSFDDVVEEVRGFFEVHAALGTHPGGIHVELTGDDVTECVGGAEGSRRAGLGSATRRPATRGSTASSRSSWRSSWRRCSPTADTTGGAEDGGDAAGTGVPRGAPGVARRVVGPARLGAGRWPGFFDGISDNWLHAFVLIGAAAAVWWDTWCRVRAAGRPVRTCRCCGRTSRAGARCA